jgi:branched-chain amino acid transport system substrate-binding protein
VGLVRKARFSAAILLTVVAMAAAACSSSASSSSSGGSTAGASGTASATAAAFKGTVQVATPCQISGPTADPECYQAVQAYFDIVNAQGGVNGYKLEDTWCDTQTDPVKGANCIKQEEADKSIVALVNEGGSQAAIPSDLASVGTMTETPSDATLPNSFPISGYGTGGIGDIKTVVGYADSQHAGKPGVLTCEYSGCAAYTTEIKSFYQARNTPVYVITGLLAAVNLQPQAVALQNQKANPVFVVEATNGDVGFIKAASAINYSPIVGFAWSCQDDKVLSQVPPSAKNLICPSPFNSTTANLQPMVNAMNEYIGQGKWSQSVYGINGWLSAQLFVDDLKQISGTPTRANVLAGMSKVTDFTSPLLAAPISFSKPGPDSAFPSVRYYDWYPDTIVNGKLVQSSQVIDTLTIK